MTQEEVDYLKKHDLYDNAILMANRILVYCHIMLFCLDEIPHILNKDFRHQLKKYCNIAHQKLDKISSDGISMFTRGGIAMAQLCLDITNDIEECIYDIYKSIYILKIINELSLQESRKYAPIVCSPYEEELQFIKNVINNYLNKYITEKNYNTYYNIVKNIAYKIVISKDKDGESMIVYDNKK